MVYHFPIKKTKSSNSLCFDLRVVFIDCCLFNRWKTTITKFLLSHVIYSIAFLTISQKSLKGQCFAFITASFTACLIRLRLLQWIYAINVYRNKCIWCPVFWFICILSILTSCKHWLHLYFTNNNSSLIQFS